MRSPSSVLLRRLACSLIVAGCLLALSPIAAAAQTSATAVKFTLKSDISDTSAVDVQLSFNMKNGEKALVKPSDQASQVSSAGQPPSVELLPVNNPGYTVQAQAGPDAGWLVTATKDGSVAFAYKVKFPAPLPATAAGEAAGEVAAPRAVASMDLKAFAAADALLVPQSLSGEPLTQQYTVAVTTAQGEHVLSPWKSVTGGFSVGSTDELLNNYIAWGKITVSNLRSTGPAINAGFTPGLSASEISAYGNNLLKIYDEMVRVMGVRANETNATVLVTGSAKYGLKAPASQSLRDSYVLFDGATTLKGPAAAAASKGWFDLWNGVSLVSRKNAGSSWLQEGLPWFYSERVAGKLGLMDVNAAYTEFTGVYASYLTDPTALTISLTDAEKNPGPPRLLSTKGAALCAALQVKLSKEATGGTKDIEWLLGQMSAKFNHFKGVDYSLVDVSEILEKATGTSWDRFFSGPVSGTTVVLASEFSTTDVFGSGGVVGGAQHLAGKGSSKNWIYLAIAIVIIFLIPVIFSTYIRRSVKIDVSMPSIFPGLEDEEDEDKDIEIPKSGVGESVIDVEPNVKPEKDEEQTTEPGDGPSNPAD